MNIFVNVLPYISIHCLTQGLPQLCDKDAPSYFSLIATELEFQEVCLCHTEVDRIDAGILLQSWTFCTFGSRRSSVKNGAMKFLACASGGWRAKDHLTE